MDVKEAIAYINHYSWSKSRPGLSRTKELLERLENPQKRLKFIHVAGSNGKGSTCAMLESVLRQAGYKTGFYLSPYVEDFRETFQICGTMISDEELCRITEQVKKEAEEMADHPTQFEIKTAVAIKFFADNFCDIVVLETGMGGELDSTNVIDAPEAAVITNIGLEHTEFLGDTLEKIASAKAGIIKTGSDVICYENKPEVMQVIREKCQKEGCRLHESSMSDIEPLSFGIEGQKFIWKGQELFLPLLGKHQLANVCAVLRTIEALRDRDYSISDQQLFDGIASVKWPARFEVMNKNPLFIIDGGHNAQCAQAMADIISTYLPNEKFTFLTGILADKDYSTMIDSIAGFAEEFFCVTPDSPRALSAGELADIIRKKGIQAFPCESVEEAVDRCLRSGRSIISFGSLYISGEVRSICRRRFEIQE